MTSNRASKEGRVFFDKIKGMSKEERTKYIAGIEDKLSDVDMKLFMEEINYSIPLTSAEDPLDIVREFVESMGSSQAPMTFMDIWECYLVWCENKQKIVRCDEMSSPPVKPLKPNKACTTAQYAEWEEQLAEYEDLKYEYEEELKKKLSKYKPMSKSRLTTCLDREYTLTDSLYRFV